VTDRRLVVLLLVIVAGLVVALVVRGCDDDKRGHHRRGGQTKTVTVHSGKAPEDLQDMSPQAARKAAAARGGLPAGADAGDLPAGAGQIPEGAIPPGAIPSGVPSGLPPGVTIPDGATGVEIPKNIRVKVRPSRKLDPGNYAFCKINRVICNRADDFQKSVRNLPGF
jgi:hypothetical protein